MIYYKYNISDVFRYVDWFLYLLGGKSGKKKLSSLFGSVVVFMYWLNRLGRGNTCYELWFLMTSSLFLLFRQIEFWLIAYYLCNALKEVYKICFFFYSRPDPKDVFIWKEPGIITKIMILKVVWLCEFIPHFDIIRY